MKKSLVLAAAAMIAGTLSFGGAQAANVMTGNASGIETAAAPFELASHRNFKGNGKWKGNGRWYKHRSHRHHHRFNNGIWLGFGLAPFYGSVYDPYYAPRRYVTSGSRHVRWCLDRYRSYDIDSNTYMGFDGDRHRCRSPYRY